MKVICVDSSNKPNDIPISKWIVKDQEYTVIKAAKLPIQGGILGFQLAEIDLTDCVPYLYFAASRFREKEPLKEKVKDKETSEELVEELVA